MNGTHETRISWALSYVRHPYFYIDRYCYFCLNDTITIYKAFQNQSNSSPKLQRNVLFRIKIITKLQFFRPEILFKLGAQPIHQLSLSLPDNTEAHFGVYKLAQKCTRVNLAYLK